MRIRGLLVLAVVLGFGRAANASRPAVAATAGGGVQRGVEHHEGGGQGRGLAGVA